MAERWEEYDLQYWPMEEYDLDNMNMTYNKIWKSIDALVEQLWRN